MPRILCPQGDKGHGQQGVQEREAAVRGQQGGDPRCGRAGDPAMKTQVLQVQFGAMERVRGCIGHVLCKTQAVPAGLSPDSPRTTSTLTVTKLLPLPLQI